jgi:hypothetical protein
MNVIESLWALFTHESFLILLSMFIGSVLIGGMNVLVLIKWLEDGFYELPWYSKIGALGTAICVLLMVALFFYSLITLLSLTAMAIHLGLGL